MWMRDATGFRGWIAFPRPDKGEPIGITFWTDEDALRDRTSSGAGLRDEIARQVEALARWPTGALYSRSRSSRSTSMED